MEKHMDTMKNSIKTPGIFHFQGEYESKLV
jgi:hypothetical protein